MEGVGLLGVLPFFALLLMLALKVGGVFAFLRRTGNVRTLAVPVAMVLAAGLVHAAFEDWLFAVGYYLTVFFWVLAFTFMDILPAAAPAAVYRPITDFGFGTFGQDAAPDRDRAMMHLFVNGLAASAGGGVTYLRNVLPHLSARGDVQVTAAVTPQLRRELSGLPRVSFPEINVPAGALEPFLAGADVAAGGDPHGAAPMFWFPPATLPCAIRRCRRFCFRETRSTLRRIFSAICSAAGTTVCGSIPASSAAWRAFACAGRTARSRRPRLLRGNCARRRDAVWCPSITDSTARHSSATRRRCRKIRQKLDPRSGKRHVAPALRQPLQLLPEF